MKRSPLAVLTALLAALLVLGTAGPALAHDSLKSSDPAKGATVGSLDRVRLEFSSKVRMPFVIVRGAGDQTEHQLGRPALDGAVVTQDLKGELPSGKYTIAYRVVSSDGHPIEGEIPFKVEGPTPGPTAGRPAEATASSRPVPSQVSTASAQPLPNQVSSAPATPLAAEGGGSASFPVWLLIVVGALVGVGIGFLLSVRGKKS
ncbi:copper resistance protein CopC [Nonomuraea sp. NPDC000554]|uniref:copper resistance CopC family protein n=1 Tax=Nonomuraea sp. NPDC000554 TaxID=3154259 RepID=UPI0033188A5E